MSKSEKIIDKFGRTAHVAKTGEINEMLKMKLQPGEKLSNQEFAQRKTDILAQRREKGEKVDTDVNKVVDFDDHNRNVNMLKGKYPWGSVTPETAKIALGKIKAITKPQERLHAMDKVWSSSDHFHNLLKGNLDMTIKVKPKITLPKVSGVTE